MFPRRAPSSTIASEDVQMLEWITYNAGGGVSICRDETYYADRPDVLLVDYRVVIIELRKEAP